MSLQSVLQNILQVSLLHSDCFEIAFKEVSFLQIQQTGAALLNEITETWGLKHQLKTVRNLFLCGSPLLLNFSHFLIDRLLDGATLIEIPLPDLQGSLDDCLSGSLDEAAFPKLSDFEGKASIYGCLSSDSSQCQLTVIRKELFVALCFVGTRISYQLLCLA